jgi:hypothetical protein
VAASKRDHRGSVSGDTSRLSRRIELAPDAEALEPTRWVHTETLALIARQGSV